MNNLRSFFLITIMFFAYLNGSAQNDCSTPYLFQTGNTYGYNLDTNTANVDSLLNFGCLSFTPVHNPLWLYFGVCDTSGTIDISLSSSNSGSDVNYIVWGPLSSPYDCNLTSAQMVACDNNFNFNFVMNLGGLQYGYYKIMLVNSGNQLDSITLTQSSGTAVACASLGCTVNLHQICKVSTDASLNKNVINWEQDSLFSGKFHIERETTTAGVYEIIDTVFSGFPLSKSYIDASVNPIQQAFRYRLRIVDSCGFVKTSDFHETIHLQSSVNQITGYPQLNWTSYVGFNYATYYIYRGTSPTSLSLYDSISTSFSTYTDVNPMSGSLYYSIGVNLPSPCTYLGTLKSGVDESFSNVAPVTVVSVEEYNQIGFSLYPNPVKSQLSISFGNKSINANIQLVDIYGRIVMYKSIDNVYKDVVDVSELKKGYYILNIVSEDGVGRKTFIKE